MKRMLVAACGALLAASLSSATALACGFDLVSVSRTAHDADRIVLGTVANRAVTGLFTYTIRVERVIKGGALAAHWVIPDAGASDCGMPLLDVGERVLLEYYKLGRITTGPWFYGWKIKSDGTVAFSDSHQPPLPKTLDDLLALYKAALPPDTSTTPPDTVIVGGSHSPFGALIAVVSLLAATATWRRSRKQAAIPASSASAAAWSHRLERLLWPRPLSALDRWQSRGSVEGRARHKTGGSGHLT